MSFKSFSTSQNSPAKDKADDQLKAVPANDPSGAKPAVKSDAASGDGAPASKS